MQHAVLLLIMDTFVVRVSVAFYRHQCNKLRQAMINPERLKAVRQSMENIRSVLQQRHIAFKLASDPLWSEQYTEQQALKWAVQRKKERPVRNPGTRIGVTAAQQHNSDHLHIPLSHLLRSCIVVLYVTPDSTILVALFTTLNH